LIPKPQAAKTAGRVAKLARIAVPESELPKLADELNGILAFMEQLNEVARGRFEECA